MRSASSAAADHSSLRGQALLPILEPVPAFAEVGAGESCSTGGCRTTPPPAGQGPRTPISSISRIRRGVPLALRLQPAGHAALGHGRDCRGHRRHRIEVRGPPRNSALHSRELHAVHGVHLRLPGHGAAQLLAGSEHDAVNGRFALRGRPGRAQQDARTSCRRSRSSRAQRMLAEIKTGTPLPTIIREVTESVDGFSAEAKTQFFSIIDKVPMAYQKVNAIFSLAGAQERPARAASSRSSSAICARAARPASRPAAITRR